MITQIAGPSQRKGNRIVFIQGHKNQNTCIFTKIWPLPGSGISRFSIFVFEVPGAAYTTALLVFSGIAIASRCELRCLMWLQLSGKSGDTWRQRIFWCNINCGLVRVCAPFWLLAHITLVGSSAGYVLAEAERGTFQAVFNIPGPYRKYDQRFRDQAPPSSDHRFALILRLRNKSPSQ